MLFQASQTVLCSQSDQKEPKVPKMLLTLLEHCAAFNSVPDAKIIAASNFRVCTEGKILLSFLP